MSIRLYFPILFFTHNVNDNIMDSLTKSLRKYLDSVKISHTTMYNTDCGNKIGNPTSTCFICECGNNTDREVSIVIDIYPMDYMFFLSAYPNVIISRENIDKMHALEMKWNRSGFMSTLVIEEEKGVVMPDIYCFKLTTCGFSGENGLEDSVWKRYIDKIEQEYSYIEEHIKDVSDDLPF